MVIVGLLRYVLNLQFRNAALHTRRCAERVSCPWLPVAFSLDVWSLAFSRRFTSFPADRFDGGMKLSCTAPLLICLILYLFEIFPLTSQVMLCDSGYAGMPVASRIFALLRCKRCRASCGMLQATF